MSASWRVQTLTLTTSCLVVANSSDELNGYGHMTSRGSCSHLLHCLEFLSAKKKMSHRS